jgi:DMSO/TMAO reductase YedYZ molybdopterin-dependent catalytic subunit
MRFNGGIGLAPPRSTARWSLEVESGPGRVRHFSLADVRALPRTSVVTELKCIEGWSQVLSWSGAAFRDFLIRCGLGTRSGRPPDPDGGREDLYRYVSLETPEGGYYVGLDMESALQPQTLLCYEMGGRPLSPAHGAPLRLAIPVKYGIKNIKRIGRIRFSDERPRDYWAERGYDWYAGL